MSAVFTNQINRSYIDKLKAKGINWLMTTITQEEDTVNMLSEDQLPRQEVYLMALKKALKELCTAR